MWPGEKLCVGALVVSIKARVKNRFGVEFSPAYPVGIVVAVGMIDCEVLWPAGFTNTQALSDIDIVKQGFECNG